MPRQAANRFGPHPVDIHVGERLRMARMFKNVSQTDLGDHLGITFQQVQKYENGSNRLSSSKLYESAQYLGVPISFFFEGIEVDTKRKSRDDEKWKPSDGIKFVMAFAAVESETLQNKVSKLLSSILAPQES